jgi:predicted ATP-grasp superfamily ATP-dependent carboligase
MPGVMVETLAEELREPTRFRELAAMCDWTLVIAPEFDDLLASRARTVLEMGGRLLGSTPFAIHETGDKLQMHKTWHRMGILQPPTNILPRGRLKAIRPTFAGPWVVKPRYGAGSQATYLLSSIDEWICTIAALRQELPLEQFLYQNCVPGLAVSVALLIGSRQIIALAPASQLLSTDGRFRYQGGSLPLPTPFAERATKLALQAVAGIDGLQGYVGVDMILGVDGVDYAIEINPRLTTSYIGLRQLCKDNLAELMLSVAQGRETKAPAWKAGEVHFGADGAIRMTSS